MRNITYLIISRDAAASTNKIDKLISVANCVPPSTIDLISSRAEIRTATKMKTRTAYSRQTKKLRGSARANNTVDSPQFYLRFTRVGGVESGKVTIRLSHAQFISTQLLYGKHARARAQIHPRCGPVFRCQRSSSSKPLGRRDDHNDDDDAPYGCV